MLNPASLPQYELKIRFEDGKKELWDPVRKKYVSFSREEYVRQCLIMYLFEKQVPAGLISVEKTIQFNQMPRRYDLVVYGRNNLPVLLAECKSPDVKLDFNTAMQSGVYNKILQAGFIVLTNGIQLLAFKLNAEGRFVQIEEVPVFGEWG